MPEDELQYWVALTRATRLGPVHWKRILALFPSVRDAWHAPLQEFRSCGFTPAVLDELTIIRKTIHPEQEWEHMHKEGISVLTINDPSYPKLLKEIYNPPALLYYKGKLNPEESFCIGVVGTRMITPYGRQATPLLVTPLAEAGLTIVSGLAFGVDALAHETTITAHGRTIGVLGSGLDANSLYPPQHRALAQRIIDSGGVLFSEYPVGTLPLRHHFPYRNRIISGLSLGVLVIEADEDSGSLITAKAALEQNRDVFAVPGTIFSRMSVGTNQLLKMGARVVTNANDIFDALHLTRAASFIEQRSIHPDNEEEARILQYVSEDPMYVDDLVRQSGLDTAAVNATLIMLEMKGKIRNIGGMHYVISRT